VSVGLAHRQLAGRRYDWPVAGSRTTSGRSELRRSAAAIVNAPRISDWISNELRRGGKAAIMPRRGFTRSGGPDRRAEVTVGRDDKREIGGRTGPVRNQRDGDADVGLFFLIARPHVSAVPAGNGLALVAAEGHPDQAGPARRERGQIGLLTQQRGRVIAHEGGEIPHGNDAVAGPNAVYQAHQVEPEVAALVPGVQPVVQIESVHVGDDGRHAAPRIGTGNRLYLPHTTSAQ
jgi:hypothetical protein